MVCVEEIMQKHVLRVNGQTSVREVAYLMKENRVGSLLVQDSQGKVEGIVTETDIVRKVIAPGLAPAMMTVAQVKSSPVIYIDRKQPVADAYELLDRYHIRHLAVTENGQIVGILSVRDLLHLIHQEHGA
ncbi:CBS domain-containing protein [Nitrospiraceae bacterium AH_259_D15_M11_P09]|nr:CBS domain-containing protein [Nitrospiraceae bacterium AH_259_D15_M11_P09]